MTLTHAPESARLRARLDDLEERYDALLSARKRAADTGQPAPSPATLANAKKLVEAARAALDAALRMERQKRKRAAQ